jgi:predicted nucleotidyltransferase
MLQNCSIMKVAGVFFDEPTKEHYLIEISKKADIAHTSVKNYLNVLKKNSIINEKIEIKGTRKFPIYTAEINNKDYKEYKKIYNHLELLESGISAFLKEKLMPKVIVLFGSYRKGDDTEESDIDLFLECQKEDLDLSQFEKRLKRKIQLHFKTRFNHYPMELKNNIINGIVLEGYLEVF